MHDWNGNGKHDFTDDYIDYHIVNDDSKETENYSAGRDSSSVTAFMIIFFLSVLAEVCIKGLGVFVFLGAYLLRALFT